MAFHPMDALQCFTSISENVPSWITRVTELAAHTARKHAEFSEEYKKLAQAQPHRRRKNSSVHSIRPESELRADVAPARSAVSNCKYTPGSLLEIVGRKSAVSQRDGDASSIGSGEGTRILRARHQLLIHYDGHAQKELEQVVRDIGTARNCIRKGKMSQVMRRPNLTMGLLSSSRSRESLRTSPLPADTLHRGQPSRDDQPASTFDLTDKQLEIAQSLCETAAHQFLRFGDCSSQLQTILTKFQLVLDTATQEVDRLRAEKEMGADGAPVEAEIGVQAALKPVDAGEDGKPPEPGSAAIEVDDAPSDSSVSIDITAFRSSRFRV